MLALSDFSALKNCVRKPVHENRSKFFQWFKITSTPWKILYLNPPVSNQNNSLGGRQQKLISLCSMWSCQLTCVLVAKDDSTLLTRALKWIWLHGKGHGQCRLAVSFPVLSTIALNYCPVGTPFGKMALAHTACAMQIWLQTNRPDFTAKDHAVASKFTRLEPLRLHVWTLGGNVGGLSQAPSKTENDHWTEGRPAGDQGQPTSRTNRQNCQRVLKATEGLYCSWGWTFQTFTVTAMSWCCYFCLHDTIRYDTIVCV